MYAHEEIEMDFFETAGESKHCRLLRYRKISVVL